MKFRHPLRKPDNDDNGQATGTSTDTGNDGNSTVGQPAGTMAGKVIKKPVPSAKPVDRSGDAEKAKLEEQVKELQKTVSEQQALIDAAKRKPGLGGLFSQLEKDFKSVFLGNQDKA